MEPTFAQAQGLEPLPSQAQLGTISQATVAALWRCIHDAVKEVSSYRPGFSKTAMHVILRDWWVDVLHEMIDRAPVSPQRWIESLRASFDAGFPHPYNLAQFLLDHPRTSGTLKNSIAKALNDTLAAYRVVHNKIVPFASEAEFQQFETALSVAGQQGATGVRAHLLHAGAELTGGRWASAIHESISAVESAARFKTGEHKKGLSDIIAQLKNTGVLPHPALAAALTKLYAYSSDQQGIRHSLVLDGAAAENERDAFLMYGLCAAFVTYLLG